MLVWSAILKQRHHIPSPPLYGQPIGYGETKTLRSRQNGHHFRNVEHVYDLQLSKRQHIKLHTTLKNINICGKRMCWHLGIYHKLKCFLIGILSENCNYIFVCSRSSRGCYQFIYIHSWTVLKIQDHFRYQTVPNISKELNALHHDDVIKWKRFPCYCPFVRELIGHRWIPRTKASDAELWCFLLSVLE